MELTQTQRTNSIKSKEKYFKTSRILRFKKVITFINIKYYNISSTYHGDMWFNTKHSIFNYNYHLY